MSFEQRAAELRANTLNTDRVNVSNADIYNELLLQNAESTQIEKLDTIIANQETQIDSVILGTNSGVLSDQIYKITLTATLTNLEAGNCKSVTLINLSTNNNIIYKFDDFNQPDELILEAGYSVKLNVNDTDYIQVKQATSTGQVLQYIVTQ